MEYSQLKHDQKFNLRWTFILTFAITVALILVAVYSGGLTVSYKQLVRGLFIQYDPTVAIIYQLRFPRIAVALLGGAMMSASGLLMQCVMRNPLADPGIIGVNAGASCLSTVLIMFFPMLSVYAGAFAFIGGLVAFTLVYCLAWSGTSSPTRLILVGVALNASLNGLVEAANVAVGNTNTANLVNAGISLHTWSEVKMLAGSVVIFAGLVIFLSPSCNLLALSDETVTSLGVQVRWRRLLISIVAVFLASMFTAIIGAISFLGLIVPHLGRLLVGSDHKVLIPYCCLLGAMVFLLADTVGRVIAYPYEISSAIVMAVIGGPVFIILLKRSRQVYE